MTAATLALFAATFVLFAARDGIASYMKRDDARAEMASWMTRALGIYTIVLVVAATILLGVAVVKLLS